MLIFVCSAEFKGSSGDLDVLIIIYSVLPIKLGGCVLASPGYPGVYPPNRVCKYLVTTSSSRTRVNLTFTSLLLPYNHCDTDYIAIHKGSTISSPLLTKICGTRKTQVEFSGPNVLIEFSSGPPIPPYDYNGFAARLEFTEIPEEPPITEIPTSSSTKSAEPGLLMDETRTVPRRIPNTICDYVYYGNITRSGQFDTRTKGWLQIPANLGSSSESAPITCKLVFYGKNSDIVHMSLFSFDLRAAACESSIEIFDGKLGKNSKCVQKICSPLTRSAEDRQDNFSEHKSIVSTGNVLTIVFHRGLDLIKEFLEGAFLFHDERLEGTLQPSTLCDVVYDGAKRRGKDMKKEGPFAEPVAGRSHQLLWNVEGPLRCSQRFDLAKGQTITLKFTSAERLVSDPHCNTRCQTENGGGGIMDEDLGGGCSCMTNLIPLSQMDHLLILAADGSGSQVSCLCGDFHHVLPIAVKSTTSLLVEYRVSHFSWTARGFGYKGTYKFDDENSCGERIKTEPSGSIDSKTKMKALPAAVRNYYHESCTWLLHSNVERQLTIEMYTSENKPCNVWNVTILQYRESMVQEELDRIREDRVGQILHTFCPKQRKKILKLPWRQNNVFIRLSSLSNSPAEYSIRWKSQIVQANNRIAAPQDSLSRGTSRWCPELSTMVVSFILFLQKNWEIASATT
ncbi:uncharacterized protein [Hetaerina americana]|uniref:uncharacterized protein n=1 Tax=Hetaerina americana TaxID=62018 RepID=UPI003A7F4E58